VSLQLLLPFVTPSSNSPHLTSLTGMASKTNTPLASTLIPSILSNQSPRLLCNRWTHHLLQHMVWAYPLPPFVQVRYRNNWVPLVVFISRRLHNSKNLNPWHGLLVGYHDSAPILKGLFTHWLRARDRSNFQALSCWWKRRSFFTPRLIDEQSKWMRDGCKVYMDSYMAASNEGSCFMVTWTVFKNRVLSNVV
jgi:hypothetical protein